MVADGFRESLKRLQNALVRQGFILLDERGRPDYIGMEQNG